MKSRLTVPDSHLWLQEKYEANNTITFYLTSFIRPQIQAFFTHPFPDPVYIHRTCSYMKAAAFSAYTTNVAYLHIILRNEEMEDLKMITSASTIVIIINYKFLLYKMIYH